jgi:hypothetical protein
MAEDRDARGPVDEFGVDYARELDLIGVPVHR